MILVGFAAIQAAAQIQVTVQGNQGPWDQGLNPKYAYGVGDNADPVVISAAPGFSFVPGETVTVSYVSGTVVAGFSGFPWVDADGDLGYVTNNKCIDLGCWPSYYMRPYPIYLVELVGTFAHNGVIVGRPFAIGDGPKAFVIPARANQLLLGANDNQYDDNAGSWILSVSSQPAGADPGQSSSLVLVNGTVNGQDVSPSKRTVVVQAGAPITGSFTVAINSSWSAGNVMDMGVTPTWGDPSTSYVDLGGFSTPVSGLQSTIDLNLTAPSAPGTYYVIAAFRDENNAGQVMSCTNSSVGSPNWGTGYAVADWSTPTIDTADKKGTVLVNYLYPSGDIPQYVPATAIQIVVPAPTSLIGVENTVYINNVSATNSSSCAFALGSNCFSIQQNFWISTPTQNIAYWGQNIVWVSQLVPDGPWLAGSAYQVWNNYNELIKCKPGKVDTKTNTCANTIPAWALIVFPSQIKLVSKIVPTKIGDNLKFDTYLNGVPLEMFTVSGVLPSGSYVSAALNESQAEADEPYEEPELAMVGEINGEFVNFSEISGTVTSSIEFSGQPWQPPGTVVPSISDNNICIATKESAFNLSWTADPLDPSQPVTFNESTDGNQEGIVFFPAPGTYSYIFGEPWNCD